MEIVHIPYNLMQVQHYTFETAQVNLNEKQENLSTVRLYFGRRFYKLNRSVAILWKKCQ